MNKCFSLNGAKRAGAYCFTYCFTSSFQLRVGEIKRYTKGIKARVFMCVKKAMVPTGFAKNQN